VATCAITDQPISVTGTAGLRPMSQRMADPRRDFSGFYAANAERVLVYLTKRCLDPELAVDLMAETFARAFSGRRRFRGSEGAEAEGWVYAIARSVLADFWRRGKAERRALARLGIEVPRLEEDEHARIAALAELDQVRSTVSEHFGRLSLEHQTAVRMRVIDEQPYSEIARRLDISEESARARVSRGLRRLAASLEETPLPNGATSHD
jgi:RNA polymerase sigma factor (sigma-70 family)